MALPRRRVFQDHLMEYSSCTFWPEEALSPEQADWLRTIRPEETLTDALKRCTEIAGQCPVAYIRGKVVETLECPLGKFLEKDNGCANGKGQVKEKDIGTNEDVSQELVKESEGEDKKDISQGAVGGAAKGVATLGAKEKLHGQSSLDFCFNPNCKTCSLLSEDPESAQLISVDFWSTERKVTSLGYLPPTFEVAHVKHLIGRKLNCNLEDLVLLCEDYPTKDLHLLQDLAEDGTIFFKVWEEIDEVAMSVRRLKMQCRDLSKQKHMVEEKHKIALEVKVEDRKAMKLQMDRELKMIEAERSEHLGKINGRYDCLISRKKKRFLQADKELNKQVQELKDQLEQVEQTGSELVERPNLDEWMDAKCGVCKVTLVNLEGLVYVCSGKNAHCQKCCNTPCYTPNACSYRVENKWARQLVTMAKEVAGKRKTK